MHAATPLKALFNHPGIITVAGAHDALSAKLVQEAGFDGVWAGGFSISASLKCIPDTSFITLSEQVAIEEHCGKIQAAKAAQDVPDFMVIARTEALMAGWGIEAVKHIYHELQNRGQHQGVHEAPSLEQASLTDILQELIEAGQDVQAIFTYKGWMDVDSFEDYQKAWAEIS